MFLRDDWVNQKKTEKEQKLFFFHWLHWKAMWQQVSTTNQMYEQIFRISLFQVKQVTSVTFPDL